MKRNPIGSTPKFNIWAFIMEHCYICDLLFLMKDCDLAN